jgi:hypothetical protein
MAWIRDIRGVCAGILKAASIVGSATAIHQPHAGPHHVARRAPIVSNAREADDRDRRSSRSQTAFVTSLAAHEQDASLDRDTGLPASQSFDFSRAGTGRTVLGKTPHLLLHDLRWNQAALQRAPTEGIGYGSR